MCVLALLLNFPPLCTVDQTAELLKGFLLVFAWAHKNKNKIEWYPSNQFFVTFLLDIKITKIDFTF